MIALIVPFTEESKAQVAVMMAFTVTPSSVVKVRPSKIPAVSPRSLPPSSVMLQMMSPAFMLTDLSLYLATISKSVVSSKPRETSLDGI